jgi:hypothetical protein
MPASAALFMDYGAAAALDPATIAWAAQVVTNGGTVSAGRKTTVNNLITGLKSDGVWTKLDRLWILAAENTQSALTDMVAGSLAVAHGSPTFTTDRGYTGVDGSNTVYLDTNYNPTINATNFTTNAAHASAWSVTNTAVASGGAMFGFVNGTANNQITILDTYTDGNIYARIVDATGSGSQGAPGTRAGHWIINRSGASATQLYQNGSLFSSPNAGSGALENGNIYILTYNQAGTAASIGTPQQIACHSLGGNLSSTNASNFYTRLRTYMTAVGVP